MTSWLSQHITQLDSMDDEVRKTARKDLETKTQCLKRSEESKNARREAIDKARAIKQASKKQSNENCEKQIEEVIAAANYKKDPNKTRKIRLQPSVQQRKVLNRWMGAVNKVYNICVADYQQNKQKNMVQHYRTIVRAYREKNEWMKNVPYEMIDGSIQDFTKALAADSAKRREQKIRNDDVMKKADFKYRSSKHNCISSVILHRCFKGVDEKVCQFYPRIFIAAMKEIGPDQEMAQIQSSEPLPHRLDYSARLVRTRFNEFYLCYSVLESKSKPPKSLSSLKVASLDPGIRTFQTVYDPDGLVVEIGVQDHEKIRKLAHASDIVRSRMYRKPRSSEKSPNPRNTKKHTRWKRGKASKKRRRQRRNKRKIEKRVADHSNEKLNKKRIKCKQRRRFRRRRKAHLRIQEKIKNRVDEVHKKTVKWLDDNYDVVLLPSFEVKQMTRRKQGRKMGRKTARSMVTWSHYRFKTRMMDRFGDRVCICNEAYTSKTCGKCGKINRTLGGKKNFVCDCGYEVDRDANGARNILLKNLSLLTLQHTASPLGSREWVLRPLSGSSSTEVEMTDL